MKMVKKILLGLVATATVLSFAGCKMGSGEGDTKGNKWDLTMTVDGTENGSPKLEKNYRRFWKQFSSSEKVAALTTTLTINPKDCKLVDGKASVIGLIFDLNKNEADAEKVDFCLIGLNPKRGKFYVERYTGISKQKNESLDTDDDQLGPTGSNADIGYGTWARTDISNWCTLNDKMYSKNTDGVMTCIVKITQENKKYSVYLGSEKVAEYNATSSKNTDKIKDVEYAVGGIACYGNAGKGVKLVAKYETEKDSVIGKLEAEEIEE